MTPTPRTHYPLLSGNCSSIFTLFRSGLLKKIPCDMVFMVPGLAMLIGPKQQPLYTGKVGVALRPMGSYVLTCWHS